MLDNIFGDGEGEGGGGFLDSYESIVDRVTGANDDLLEKIERIYDGDW